MTKEQPPANVEAVLHAWEIRRAGNAMTIHHSAGRVTNVIRVAPVQGKTYAFTLLKVFELSMET